MKSPGRKMKYGEETVPMRIPVSLVPKVEKLLKERELIVAEWEESLLPPVAEKLVQRLAKIMSYPLQLAKEGALEHAKAELEKATTQKRKKELLRSIEELESWLNDDREILEANSSIARGLLLEAIEKKE